MGNFEQVDQFDEVGQMDQVGHFDQIEMQVGYKLC